MPRIVVLATGGTIASRSDATGAAVARDGAAELLNELGAARDDIVLESVDVLRKNSFNLTLGDVRTVAEAIASQLARPEVDGVVVTHGTDTIEETAYFADLVHGDARPVVFTGAQRSADHGAGDGQSNLRDAIHLAASPESRDLGVLVSFAHTVFAARGVRKVRSLDLAPFWAPAGPIGMVRSGTVEIHSRPTRHPARTLPGPAFDEVRVDAVHSYPGADAALLQSAVSAGASGIVVVGTGAGNPNSVLSAAIGEATRAGVVVGLASRTIEGGVAVIYGGGGAVDAVQQGAVPVGELSWTQARILLALLISDDLPSDELRAAIERYGSSATAPRPEAQDHPAHATLATEQQPART